MEAAVQRGKAAKIVLLGDSGVGKSSICLRFCQDKFDAKTESTIGASFFQKNLKLDDATMRLEIWDTAGIFFGIIDVDVQSFSYLQIVYANCRRARTIQQLRAHVL